jgi:hypothetical protein
MSSEFHVFCGGFAVSRGASDIGATVDEGWFSMALVRLGELSDALVGAGVDETRISDSLDNDSWTSVLTSGLTRFGFVIGIADLVTVREAIALARAR